MSTHDWSRFQLRINVGANRETVYDAWTTTEGIESWFLRSARFNGGQVRGPGESIKAGDTYEWLWYGYGDDVIERNDIVTANGRDLVEFRFAGDCLVSVAISEVEGEIIVELTQSNIPLDEPSRVQKYLGCMEGWTFYLANLKSILEGGRDLRNRKMNIGRVINS